MNEGTCREPLSRSLRHLAKMHGMVGVFEIATPFAEGQVHG
jgi:hypothetical protein